MKQLLMAIIGLFLLQEVSIAQPSDLPRTPAELNRWYVEPPTNQNAATFILQGDSLVDFPKTDWDSPDLPWAGARSPLLGHPLPASMSTAISNLLYRNCSALTLFQKSANYEQCRFPMDFTQYEQEKENRFLCIGGTGSATFLLSLRALWLAEANKGAEAGEMVIVNLSLAQSIETYPDIDIQRFRCFNVAMIVESLEQVFNRSTIPPPVLEQLRDGLNRMENHEAAGIGLRRGFVALRILHPKANSNTEEGRFIVETLDNMLAAWKEPYPERIKVMERIYSVRESIANQKHFSLSGIRGYHNINRSEALSLAFLRLAQTAVALERYRAAHHNIYPRFLSDLKPIYLAKAPEDPFDGKPLRYRKAGSGYVLYSIGPDLKDDSASRDNRSYKERRGSDQGDLVFTVVKPPDQQQ